MVIGKDIPAIDAASHRVVERARKMDSWNSSHTYHTIDPPNLFHHRKYCTTGRPDTNFQFGNLIFFLVRSQDRAGSN